MLVIVLVTTAIPFLGMASPALALRGAVFVVTDLADQDYLRGLGLGFEPAKCILPRDVYGVVYVLDYNTVACGGWPRSLGERLLELAENGATVVLGYNTLRFMGLYEPTTLEKLGLVLEEVDAGTETIRVTQGLRLHGAPASLEYDSGCYHRFYAIKQANWRVLASFSDNSPAIAVMPFGRGRLVLLFFNPVWPTVNGQREYLDLVRAIHEYITGAGRPVLPIVAAAATVAASAAAYTTSSLERAERALRRAVRPGVAIAILAHRVRGRDAAEHPVRAKILELVERNGYVTLDMVTRELAIKRTSAVWHLTLLTSVGLLATSKVLNKQIYYKKSQMREAILAFLLEAAPRRRIAFKLLQGPYSISQLARSLNMSKSTIKHHIDALRLYGIVEEAGYGYRLADWARSFLLRLLGEEIRSRAIAAQPEGRKDASPN